MAGNFRTSYSSYVTRKREIRKICVSVPGCSGIGVLYECFSSNKTRTIVHIIKNSEFIGVQYRAASSYKIRSTHQFCSYQRQLRNYYGLRPGEPGGPQPQWGPQA
jgi:hypothetical protein